MADNVNQLDDVRSNTVTASPGDQKAVLLRLLASAEVGRLGIEPSDDEIREMTRWWRGQFDLLTLDSFAEWLAYSGMGLERFMSMMRDFAALTKVQEYYQEAITGAMDNHKAIHSVHEFVRRSAP